MLRFISIRNVLSGSILYSFVLLILSCQQNTPTAAPSAGQSEAVASEKSSAAGPAFRLSDQAPPDLDNAESNWCQGHRFQEHLIINAEKEQMNRRYFYLPGGMSKLAVGPTGEYGTLMLRPAANGDVEVFTGANYPACLSNPAHISPAGGGAVLHYDNHHQVQFAMELRTEQGHPLVTVEIPPAGTYVIMADHCEECR